jgi:predicted  nucleic acid-binding Zn-ribbon protein
MPPRAKSQGESKQGLIITLVFFILATIGLGVATYFGFSEQDRYEKTAKDAKKSEETFKAERDYYKAQAMVYRGYMGMTEGMDGADSLGTIKSQLDSGSLGKNSKDNADVKKVLESLNTKYGWNGNQPKETLEGTIARLNTEKENLTKQIVTLKADLDKARKTIQTRDEELRLAREDYGKNLKELRESLKKDFEKSTKDLEDFRTEVAKLSDALTNEKEKAEKEKNALLAQIKNLKEVEIKSLKERIKDREDRLAAIEAKSEIAPPSMRTDWKIIDMDRRGLNPYINLGSADHVNRQLTFTIHGVAADGRPNPQPKGTLEVINVIGPHLSQTRITSVKDRNRDPVTTGDVIYNASWNPNLKKHVAIAGIIDLTGDGRDSLQEFMRTLERQNIVVDAYLNPKDGTMKGKITFQTDYLILGDLPSSAGEKVTDQEKKIGLGQKHMQDEAKKYGVQPVNLVRYLEMIGYRLPHSAREARPSLYNPDLRPDQAPRVESDKLPPPMPRNR